MKGTRAARWLGLWVGASLVWAATGAIGGGGAPQAGAAATRPNVLVILTDDQRFEGTGGAEGFLSIMPNVRTWMQRGGAFFPNAFATTSLCCPSRGALMTGRYAHNTGVRINGDTSEETVFDQTTTMQYRLHQAGYQTAMVGKYFNTWPLGKAPPYFDHFAYTKGGYWDADYNVDGVVAEHPGYTTTISSNYALQFLQGFAASDPGRPWFLYLAPEAPHSPYSADTKYQGRTLVVYAGDNGMMWGEHGLIDKRFPYGPSVKVQLLLRWPGHVTAGSTWPRLVGLLDIAPTVLDATGTPYDAAKIDGAT